MEELRKTVFKHRFTWTRDKLVYLCGPIDFCLQGGVGWRDEIINKLTAIGVMPECILDPTDKPLPPQHYLAHSPEKNIMEEYTKAADRQSMHRLIGDLAHIDLRMVDHALCVFAYVPKIGNNVKLRNLRLQFEQSLESVNNNSDKENLRNSFYEIYKMHSEMNVPTFGTIHEIVQARIQKKPVFMIWEGEKKSEWLKWLVHEDYVFPNIDSAVQRLKDIMKGIVEIDFSEWLILDLDSNDHKRKRT